MERWGHGWLQALLLTFASTDPATRTKSNADNTHGKGRGTRSLCIHPLSDNPHLLNLGLQIQLPLQRLASIVCIALLLQPTQLLILLLLLAQGLQAIETKGYNC